MADTDIQKAARRSLEERTAQLEAMVNESTDQAALAMRDRDRMTIEQNKRMEQYKAAMQTVSKSRQIGVDLGGGISAMVSSELLNWGFRALGDWSKDGWLARNSDFMQAIPNIAIGTLVYIAEMVTRPPLDKKLPTKTRQVMSEASKIFATAGYLNLSRAVRFRFHQGKSLRDDNAALRAEVAAFKAAASGANGAQGNGNGQSGGGGNQSNS